jgi:uncharacterized protein YjlB
VDCEAIIRGSSRLALGRAKDVEATDGIEVNIRTGDVIVIPAGVSHRSLKSEEGFRYIGVYPEVSFQSEYGIGFARLFIFTGGSTMAK